MKHLRFFLVVLFLSAAISVCFADAKALKMAVVLGEASEVKAQLAAGADVNAKYESD